MFFKKVFQKVQNLTHKTACNQPMDESSAQHNKVAQLKSTKLDIPDSSDWQDTAIVDTDAQFALVADAFRGAEPGQEITVELSGPPSKELIGELERKGYSYQSEYQLSCQSGQKPVQLSKLIINPRKNSRSIEYPLLYQPLMPLFRHFNRRSPFGLLDF